LIVNNNFQKITKVTQSDIRKLENPLKELGGLRHSIVFIYPSIILDSITKDNLHNLLRRFFAASMLKEINIYNILTQVEKLLDISDEISTVRDDVLKKLSSKIIETGAEEKLAATSSNYLTHQISSDIEKQISSKSSELYKKLKNIILKDPYYQQYQAVVSYKEVNGIRVPLVIGTKNYQVSDYAFGMVLLASIITDLPLNNLANVYRLERIFKTKSIQDLINSAEKTNGKNLFEKVKNWFKSIGARLNPKNIYLIKLFTLYLDAIYNKVDSLSSPSKSPYTDMYYKLTNNEIDQVFTILKLCTNIHYYSSQLNDRFSEYAINSYRILSQKKFKEIITKYINNLVNIQNKDIIDDFPEYLLNNIQKDLDDLINKNDYYNFDKEKLVKFIMNNIDQLIEIEENNKNKCDKLKDLPNLSTYVFPLIKKSIDETIDYIVNKIKVDTIKNDIDMSDIDDSYLVKAFIDIFKSGEPDLQKQIIEPCFKVDIDNYKKTGRIINSDNDIKKILSELGFDIFVKDNNIFKTISNDLMFIIDKISSIFNNYVLFFESELTSYFERQIEEKVLNVISGGEEINNKKKSKLVNKFKEKITAFIDRIFAAIQTNIICYTLCAYLKSFLNYLQVTKYTIDEKELTKELIFPNYLLILPEQLINFIASLVLAYKPETITNLDWDELEPKKIITPINSNLKYNTEFIVRKCKIPSIISVSANRQSIAYKFPYMNKVEKTSIENVMHLLKIFDPLK
jgi:hypothetical protein